MKKIVAVAGDVTFPGFGLSPEDLQLIHDNVSIVFNSAATDKFDEELKTAVQLNVKGPRELLAICRKMKKLQVKHFGIICGKTMYLILTQMIE